MTRDEPREHEAALDVGDTRLARRKGRRNRPDLAVDDFHVATDVDLAGHDVHDLCVCQPRGLSRGHLRPCRCRMWVAGTSVALNKGMPVPSATILAPWGSWPPLVRGSGLLGAVAPDLARARWSYLHLSRKGRPPAMRAARRGGQSPDVTEGPDAAGKPAHKPALEQRPPRLGFRRPRQTGGIGRVRPGLGVARPVPAIGASAAGGGRSGDGTGNARGGGAEPLLGPPCGTVHARRHPAGALRG